jgi:hypothetical protein
VSTIKRSFGLGRLAVLVGALMLFATQASGLTQGGKYAFQVSSVNSATVPVQVMPQALRESYSCVSSNSAIPLYCWSYLGATPASAPSDYLVVTTAWKDAIISPPINLPPQSNLAVSQAWACVLSSGTTPVSVSCVWR